MISDLRKWIRLVEANLLLIEAKMQTITVFGSTVRVWTDPTETEFFKLFQNVGNPLRGTLDQTGHLHVWDALLATHSSVDEALSVNGFRMMLRPDRITVEGTTMNEDEIRNAPAIIRAYGKHDFDLYDDSAEPEWEGDEDDE